MLWPRRLVWVLGALAIVVAVGGCRRPEPVYDRFPDPISIRDVVRAERSGTETGEFLTEVELLAVEAILDAHQAAYTTLRHLEIDPFLRSLPSAGEEAASAEPPLDREMRSLIHRHRALFGRVTALDATALGELADVLGPGRTQLVARIRASRQLARVNALMIGDGGGVLFDLRGALDRSRLEPSVRAGVEADLRKHEEEAAPILDRLADAQMDLPMVHRDVLARLGPPEADVPADLEGDARDRAVNLAMVQRISDARRDLERELRAYQDLLDRSLASMVPALPADRADRIARRLERERVPNSRGPEQLEYLIRIATLARDMPSDARVRIEAALETFLTVERRALRAAGRLVADRRAEREAGNEESWRTRWSEALQERSEATKRLREAFDRDVPEELRGQIMSLGQRSAQEFPAALAGLVGAGAVRALIADRPAGFGDRPTATVVGRGTSNSGTLQELLAGAPTDRDAERLCARAHLGADDRRVVRSIVAMHREQWDAEVEDSKRVFEVALRELFDNGRDEEPTAREIDRGIGRILALVEERRQTRLLLDRALQEDLAAAMPALVGAPLELWRLERLEDGFHLNWSNMPNGDLLSIAPLAKLRFFDALALSEVAGEQPEALLVSLGRREEAMIDAGVGLRAAALQAVRRIMVLESESRNEGDDDVDRMARRSDRLVAPAISAAEQFAALQAEALAACASALPPVEGRHLRAIAAELAVPGLTGETTADRWLEELLQNAALEPEQRRWLEAICERRAIARDAALDPILARAALAFDPDPTGLRDGGVIAAQFARREADGRALRQAWAMLNQSERDRVAGMLDWFDERPRATRSYD